MVHEGIPRGVPSAARGSRRPGRCEKPRNLFSPNPSYRDRQRAPRGTPTLDHHDRDAAAPKLTGRRDTRGTTPDDDCSADLGHDYPSPINPSAARQRTNTARRATTAMDCDESGPPRSDAQRVTEERARGGPYACCTLDWI